MLYDGALKLCCMMAPSRGRRFVEMAKILVNLIKFRLICTHDIFLRGRSLLPRLADFTVAVVGLLVLGSVGPKIRDSPCRTGYIGPRIPG